ncbi:hypothetical protein E6P09_02910 [Haloferax mediterranei ATCC 33500]|uniref:Uncharacterized protein n=1 Tax=Haloferax mediterranei (strain ATCC 33500 / DSM 1411 / JCM 8866 / NBRC 14739 / NCIMB 2177 / R-4) TaxID=523841 RepID=I3R8U9_HALMT|nr:hypothetical protein [Haloferax mediterranei]AFK20659.1 hypothetical protein HFX_2995 [Haloferax mediterranei ATCC 33500]AHZ22857.1 hypothetical protein BM92_09500 [Haloferax mediterranei ATCC 33500]EMA03021.1 hypothetical protein C439_10570 [Haloferax mediterranei ATCC 33500]MDX5987797.1 hypothetical protein [Haloferax mediterranei ATCC 33500]QCQ74275.1 hypothetical protein E6P09_02910 [Haloferax mediterranei ATCC 33500]
MGDAPEEVTLGKLLSAAMGLIGSQVGVALILGDSPETGVAFGTIAFVVLLTSASWSDSLVLGRRLLEVIRNE